MTKNKNNGFNPNNLPELRQLSALLHDAKAEHYKTTPVFVDLSDRLDAWRARYGSLGRRQDLQPDEQWDAFKALMALVSEAAMEIVVERAAYLTEGQLIQIGTWATNTRIRLEELRPAQARRDTFDASTIPG